MPDSSRQVQKQQQESTQKEQGSEDAKLFSLKTFWNPTFLPEIPSKVDSVTIPFPGLGLHLNVDVDHFDVDNNLVV